MDNLHSNSPVRNIDSAELMDFMSPKGKFAAMLCRMGPSIGAEKLGACYTVLEPGKKSFPFHAHHVNEEMMFVIEGEGEYRFGAEIYTVRAGDLIAARASHGSSRNITRLFRGRR